MDIAYFEEAVDYLRSRDEVQSDKGIGLWSISQGGTIALAMAALLGDKIKAVVVINAMFKSVIHPVLYKEKVMVPAYNFDQESIKHKAKNLGNNIVSIRDWEPEEAFTEDETFIPFYNSNAKFLYVASEDDGIGNYVKCGQIAMDVMKAKGKDDSFEMVTCPGAGHYIDLPYSPVLRTNLHPFFPKPFLLHYGGENPELHSRSQENAWQNIWKFYNNMLK